MLDQDAAFFPNQPTTFDLGPRKARVFVDPLPQALVLTAIVIGLAVTALMVAICLRIYDRYGTFNIAEIRRLKG